MEHRPTGLQQEQAGAEGAVSGLRPLHYSHVKSQCQALEPGSPELKSHWLCWGLEVLIWEMGRRFWEAREST